MKKILAIVLWVMLSFQILSIWQITQAQQEQTPPQNEGNSSDEDKTKTNENTSSQWSTSNIDIWLQLNWDCLTWVWSNCFKYEKLLGVWNENTSSKSIFEWVQDAILAATSFVWTILVVVLLYCGFNYILAANSNPWKATKLKDYMINAAIWAILVRCSYLIVRIVQYVAQW